MIQVGAARMHGHVLEKPDVRVSKDGKTSYYTLVIGDVGWRARVACSFGVYSNVVTTTPDRSVRYQFDAKFEFVRATRAGSNFADDFAQMTVDNFKDLSAPAAAPAAAPAGK